ncbi:ATP-binding protein [Burkholderia sp. Bp9126]|nr:ATP-binding protein [Burkholderia sp. Bp9126]
MQIFVVDSNREVNAGQGVAAFLVDDRWDDWGKFRTQFALVVIDEQGQKHYPGDVKIGKFGLKAGNQIAENTRAPSPPGVFESLPLEFFSLGQNETYYETLGKLDPAIRQSLLTALNDVAYNLTLFELAKGEEVMQESLLRSVPAENVKSRFHRLAHGDAVLTSFRFRYEFPAAASTSDSHSISFEVEPGSLPPTNVHVLIGRNGVGKTTCMQNIGRALLGVQDSEKPAGSVLPLREHDDDWSFSNLVSVSFSAFDNFDLPEAPSGMRATMVGLRYTIPDTKEVRVSTPPQLAADFTTSFATCRRGLRAQRWRKAVETLSNDPLFAEANALLLLDLGDEDWRRDAEKFFGRLSSGHKIVLLTITRLVELVDERTLVLLDEPEGHLHPPLLSAFIRSLGDLLVQRNGVAIIATHSPVVLQEVPNSCVWMLRRAGSESTAERPAIETFGENVGVLTREVFGLEVTTTGFHQTLNSLVNDGNRGYEDVLGALQNRLGAEGRAIAMGLVANRNGGGV